MTKKIAEKIVKGITDKIECNTADIDDWAEFWGFTREEYEEFLNMAVEAIEQEPQTFEWCTDCREYDQKKHCCHRWSKVIRSTVEEMKQEPCEDKIIEWKKDFKEYINALSMPRDDYKEIMEYIAELPATFIQPEYNTSEWCHDCSEYDQDKHCCPRFNKVIRNTVDEIKQAKTGHCKDCKYFEYDHFENMGGIPLITTHKVCKRHGLICKTDEDGYCHLWEHKAESEGKE